MYDPSRRVQGHVHREVDGRVPRVDVDPAVPGGSVGGGRGGVGLLEGSLLTGVGAGGRHGRPGRAELLFDLLLGPAVVGGVEVVEGVPATSQRGE